MKPKEIEIYDIRLLKKVDKNTLEFKVACSSGTFIRSLCRDIAKELSTCGVMQRIIRTRCGIFDLKDSYTLQDIENGKFSLIGADTIFEQTSISLDEREFELVRNGVQISDMPCKDGKYKVQVNRVNANYVIGPIVLDKNNSKNYNITFTPTNEKNEIVEYKFSDKDGNEINDVTLENYIGNADGFYITVSRSSAEEINLKLEVKYEMTNKKLWLSGSEEDGKLKLDNEQILIELTQETKNETTELTAKIEEFDLSLRTYIKAINEQNLDNENYRIPQVSLDTLKTGTTAIYNHRKSPVAVNENDLITYEIAIFNEGTISGYASQIIQQLPEGLISSTDNPAEIYSKDKPTKVLTMAQFWVK